jgi:hypothetical protein
MHALTIPDVQPEESEWKMASDLRSKRWASGYRGYLIETAWSTANGSHLLSVTILPSWILLPYCCSELPLAAFPAEISSRQVSG